MSYRTRKVTKKWEPQVIPRAFKVLEAARPYYRSGEFKWEMDVMLLLELMTFDVLNNWGIPGEQWTYYVIFAKRLWERAQKFTGETFLIEKASLIHEFTERGLDPDVLTQIQVQSEFLALYKQGQMFPSAWAYTDTVGSIFVHEYGGYDTGRSGGIWLPEPEGSSGGYYDNRT